VNTIYYYRAYAVNSVGTGIGGSDVSFFTLANTPSAPTVNGATPNSLNVAITAGDGNPAATVYAIQETTSGNYVQTSGASGGGLGVSAVYKTAASWSITPVTNLSASTTYTFAVVATNGAGTATSFSSTASGTTQPTPLAAWDVTGPGNTATFAATLFNADLDSANTITRGANAAASVGANSFRNDRIPERRHINCKPRLFPSHVVGGFGKNSLIEHD